MICFADVEQLALYIHQSRRTNDDPEFDMDVARERARKMAARATTTDTETAGGPTLMTRGPAD